MVGGIIACEETEGRGILGGLLDLSGGEDAGGIGIEEQGDHHFGGIGCPSSFAIGSIEGFEVELLDHIDDKACEVIGGQAIAQAHTRVESSLVVEGFE